MMTAAQAREKTLEKILQTAKEFRVNSIEPKIDESVGFGSFKCTVKHSHTPTVRDTVKELLEKEGYSVVAEPTYYSIAWENNN